jgi:hypothetical protein
MVFEVSPSCCLGDEAWQRVWASGAPRPGVVWRPPNRVRRRVGTDRRRADAYSHAANIEHLQEFAGRGAKSTVRRRGEEDRKRRANLELCLRLGCPPSGYPCLESAPPMKEAGDCRRWRNRGCAAAAAGEEWRCWVDRK